MTILGIDHVQLAMPPGNEGAARAFYVGLLGFDEAVKPPALAGRGGAWFESGQVKLHLSVDADFRPARKAHPALLVDDLSVLVACLEAAGIAIGRDVALEGYGRVHVHDPFGNRIELMQETADAENAD